MKFCHTQDTLLLLLLLILLLNLRSSCIFTIFYLKYHGNFLLQTLQKHGYAKTYNVVTKYFCSWLDLPISGTLSNVFLPHKKYGLNVHPPSVKYAQCKTTLHNLLKSSPNDAMHTSSKGMSASTKIQYDQYKNTKDVLKSFHLQQEGWLRDQLFS